MIHREHRRLLPLLSTCVLACGPELSADLGSVEGRTFLSERVLENGAPRTLAGGTRLVLGFDQYGPMHINAYGGCNWWTGSYAIDDDKLVTNGDHTLIGCPNGRNYQEHWYYTFLESSPSLALDGHALVLEGGGTRIEYRDEATATPDLALVGHTWVVDSILESEDTVELRPPRPATLVFELDESPLPTHAHGTMTFDTGCNTGSGTYHAEEGRGIRFTDLTLTQNICDGDAAHLESLVFRVLDSEHVSWEIVIDQLWLADWAVALELVASND